MSTTKKLPKYITEARMATLLSRFAAAADATFAIRLNAMEERLRDEFGASRILSASDDPAAPIFGLPIHGPRYVSQSANEACATYEGNHLAPTPAEGAE